MKKVTLLLVGFFCSLTMFAGEITKEQAMEKARQVLKGKQLIMQTTNAYWYTIDGRRLTAKPTRQGLYIQGGQKRIVK